ncbi:MAG: NAD-dependent epimerase/dehydratase family protein [Bryobacteraceae bacterium]
MAGRPRTVSAGPVLVLGGASYLGSMLCRRLLERRTAVRVLDPLQHGDLPFHELTVHPCFDLIAGDAFDLRVIARAMEGASAVVSLLDVAEPELYAGYLSGIASFASRHDGTRFIIVREGPVKEPEKALLAATSQRAMVAVLQLAGLFGVSWRDRPELLVHRMVAQAWRGETLRITHGSERRSFIHVRDAADGIIAALFADQTAIAGQILALGDQRLNYSRLQIAHAIRAQFPSVEIEEISSSAIAADATLNFDRARKRLGFACSLPLEAGIRELRVSHLLEQKSADVPALGCAALAGAAT